jgi:translation initiation factor 1
VAIDGIKEVAGLHSRLGCGGTCKDGIIEIQGDKRDQLMTELDKKGWKVKRVGG